MVSMSSLVSGRTPWYVVAAVSEEGRYKVVRKRGTLQAKSERQHVLGGRGQREGS